ncbi:uncharacterized protein LOC121271118 isoform X2 [Carcharodon carcharias]|uniref:uncharacterized protein LOC121271118 isoform X2 n=1 Tax=Carcharodon carcharias TaxID=13397 RepID=UPI001B7E8837|nr:uncharacterized protein LOC121271118 isoform X2 [Carcharodon carcharias]
MLNELGVQQISAKVKCYGEGSIHEAILKKLNISGHDGGPGVPCILFVYKVSRENEDLRNALRCITENGTTQKEDIFVVFLLTKISKNCKDVGEEKITGLDLFHEDTKVFRILWKDTSGFWPGFSCPEAIRTVTEKICQNNMRSQGVGQRANIWPNVLRLGLVLGSIRMLALLARLICRPVA